MVSRKSRFSHFDAEIEDDYIQGRKAVKLNLSFLVATPTFVRNACRKTGCHQGAGGRLRRGLLPPAIARRQVAHSAPTRKVIDLVIIVTITRIQNSKQTTTILTRKNLLQLLCPLKYRLFYANGHLLQRAAVAVHQLP
ncbi:hypothetical protein EVAR_38010_1 [Eumeta japonica]|uniref:Uncharacterized protein n=1 Tax=Eumeta variegata TaxID=151549 RepID=A0A4C1WW61_EUMVA|nr:hypothetical protein EVAR_38010_1 [Eumeta japonica]